MITTRLGQISRADTTVLYAFEMCIENDTERLENSDELEEIIIGGTDEIIGNFNRLSIGQKNICVLRINALLEVYYNGR